jgi:hypothetical protein
MIVMIASRFRRFTRFDGPQARNGFALLSAADAESLGALGAVSGLSRWVMAASVRFRGKNLGFVTNERIAAR